MTEMRIYNKAVKRKIYCLFCLCLWVNPIFLHEKSGYMYSFHPVGWNEYFEDFSMPIIVEDIGK